MADTGAPWNLPYPLDTDLVRDGAQAIEDLADAVASSLTAAQTLVSFHRVTKTDAFSEAIGARPAESGDITGLTVTMTPASATNLLLVQVVVSTDTSSPLRLYRDGSVVTGYLGDAVGSRQQASVFGASSATITTTTTGLLHTVTAGATTATTFSIRIGTTNSSGTTVYVNRASDDTNSNARARTASSMIVMEIAA
jgi:hypothetical protein